MKAFGRLVGRGHGLWFCAPVFTDRYALPEVVGPDGWLVPDGPSCVAAAVQAITEALAALERQRGRFRQHVVPDRGREFDTSNCAG